MISYHTLSIKSTRLLNTRVDGSAQARLILSKLPSVCSNETAAPFPNALVPTGQTVAFNSHYLFDRASGPLMGNSFTGESLSW